jgi:hypothetical protein
MRLVLVVFVAAIVPGGGNANADFIFGEPTNLGPKVNTSYGDCGSCISADGLSLYFCDLPFNPAPGGYGGDDMVDCADMCIVIDYWGTGEQLCDIDPMPWGDGVVDVNDLIVLVEYRPTNINDVNDLE